MFLHLQTEVLDRFAVTEAFFKSVLKSTADQRTKAFTKGIVFVQIYGAYEYSVNGVVMGAIDAVVACGRPYSELRPRLQSLMLHDQLKSVRECGPKKSVESRMKLFDRLNSADPILLENTTFPSDGSHYRKSQLFALFKVFGIRGIPARRHRHLHRINEVVEHRNEIAHGRTTADQIGRGYTYAEILKTIGQVQNLCLFLIARVGDHFSDPQNYCR